MFFLRKKIEDKHQQLKVKKSFNQFAIMNLKKLQMCTMCCNSERLIKSLVRIYRRTIYYHDFFLSYRKPITIYMYLGGIQRGSRISI